MEIETNEQAKASYKRVHGIVAQLAKENDYDLRLALVDTVMIIQALHNLNDDKIEKAQLKQFMIESIEAAL